MYRLAFEMFGWFLEAEGAVAVDERVNHAVQALAVDYATIKGTVVTASQARSGGRLAALPIF